MFENECYQKILHNTVYAHTYASHEFFIDHDIFGGSRHDLNDFRNKVLYYQQRKQIHVTFKPIILNSASIFHIFGKWYEQTAAAKLLLHLIRWYQTHLLEDDMNAFKSRFLIRDDSWYYVDRK